MLALTIQRKNAKSSDGVLQPRHAVCVLISPDGVGDRVEGEHPGRSAEGFAPQHGLQPERPLPAALFCNTEGASVKGQDYCFYQIPDVA